MIRLLAVVALVACSSRSSAPTHPQPTDAGRGVSRPEGTPDDGECDKLLAHTFELALAEYPRDHQLDDTELAKLRAEARPTMLAECRTMSRIKYRCAIASTKLVDMTACDTN